MHVERRTFLVRFGHDSRLHKFANGRLHELLRVCRSAILLHLGNLVKSHFSSSYVAGGFAFLITAGRLIFLLYGPSKAAFELTTKGITCNAKATHTKNR